MNPFLCHSFVSLLSVCLGSLHTKTLPFTACIFNETCLARKHSSLASKLSLASTHFLLHVAPHRAILHVILFCFGLVMLGDVKQIVSIHAVHLSRHKRSTGHMCSKMCQSSLCSQQSRQFTFSYCHKFLGGSAIKERVQFDSFDIDGCMMYVYRYSRILVVVR